MGKVMERVREGVMENGQGRGGMENSHGRGQGKVMEGVREKSWKGSGKIVMVMVMVNDR